MEGAAAERAVAGRGASCRRDLPWGRWPGSRLRSSVRSSAWYSWRGSYQISAALPTRLSNTELLAATCTFAGTAALPAAFPWPWLFPLWLRGPRGNPRDLRAAGLPARRELEAGKGWRGPICSRQHRALFLLRTPVGDNDTRLAAYIGVPLVICYLPGAAHRLALGPGSGRVGAGGGGRRRCSLRQWRRAWSPGTGHRASTPSTPPPTGRRAPLRTTEPLIAELASLSRHGPVRVEVPPTAHHWESAYVAPKFDLARGWERQLDIAYDPLFYQAGPLTASEYRTWLLANGVSFVALADAPLDYAATAEARLLRSGEVQGLRAVWHTASWQLWRVIGSQGALRLPPPPSSR